MPPEEVRCPRCDALSKKAVYQDEGTHWCQACDDWFTAEAPTEEQGLLFPCTT